MSQEGARSNFKMLSQRMDGLSLRSKRWWVEVTGFMSTVQYKEESVFSAFFVFFPKGSQNILIVRPYPNLWIPESPRAEQMTVTQGRNCLFFSCLSPTNIPLFYWVSHKGDSNHIPGKLMKVPLKKTDMKYYRDIKRLSVWD